tara:strand:- start:403828 stop:404313 length:486 start_codon:yes stop_codon:yes gene_type:complete
MVAVRIIEGEERKLIGMRLEMSLTNNRTHNLFQKFIPRKKEITNVVSEDVFALQHYDLLNFTPQTIFEKWACVEVTDFNEIPDGMESFLLEPGTYAVFTHIGSVTDFVKTFRSVLTEYLPTTSYSVDNRPHFEILGSAYLGPTNPNSEEEVWIPIAKKADL